MASPTDQGRNQESLVFTLSGSYYALLLSAVDRVVRAVEVTPLPGVLPFLLGIINVGGTVVPVIDLRMRLGLPTREVVPGDRFLLARTPRRTVALVADSVVGLRSPGDGALVGGDLVPWADSLHGVTRCEDNLVLIYDLERFLSLDEERLLDDALARSPG